jgi:hypothetical protein
MEKYIHTLIVFMSCCDGRSIVKYCLLMENLES